jgi:hypothetical protein
VTKARVDWTQRFPSKPPSEAGKHKTFAADQSKSPRAFHFERPPEASPTIPITLRHPIFGQFQEDCETYTPTKADHDFVLQFSRDMSKFYDKEHQRAERARELLDEYGIPVKTDSIGSYTTDGDMRWRQFVYVLLEYKLELCSGGAEPLFQAAWYYADIMRRKLNDHPNIQLPCLLLYAFGKFRR